MFQFPPNPIVGQAFTPLAGITFKWNGTAWFLVNSQFLLKSDADLLYVPLTQKGAANGIATLDAAGKVPLAQLPAFAGFNRIINGKMAINQRFENNNRVIGPGGSYTLDRFFCGAGGPGVFTATRLPEFPGSQEFILRLAVTTPDLAPPSGAAYGISQAIEGYNIADLGFGTPAAVGKFFTLAFDVVSNTAGQYSVSFRNGAGTHSYVVPYTIAVAGVKQTVVVTVPGQNNGVWDNNVGSGLIVNWGLSVGATFQVPIVNAWVGGNFIGIGSNVNWMTAGNFFSLSNVRLYAGAVDLGPDTRRYADELVLCQRYYRKSYSQGVAPGVATAVGQLKVRSAAAAQQSFETFRIPFAPVMRATPAVAWISPVTGALNTLRDVTAAVDVAVASTFEQGDASSGWPSLSAGMPSSVGNFISAHYTADAEY